MNALDRALIEIAVVSGGTLLWLIGAFVVLYRGFVVPSLRMDDVRFEVAERRGLISASPETEDLATAERKARWIAVLRTWRDDPEFKAEVKQRYRQVHPYRQTHTALLCGGAWALSVAFAAPLRQALIPEGFDLLFPVYILVGPLWVAVVVLAVVDRAAAERRRAAAAHF